MEHPYPGSYKTTLKNGLRVLVEPLPDRPLSLGMWVTVGSRDETPELAGVTHFLEHMVFKGTKRRTASQISEEVDALGGYINALTHKEYTLFHIDSLPQHLEASLDILADLVNSPRFHEDDIAKEKGVVLEEIRMVEDDPQEKVFDLFTEKIWNHGHPLSRPILGWPATVTNLNRAELQQQHAYYHPENLVLTAAGAVKPEDVIRVAQEQFGDLKSGPKLKERWAPQTNTHFHLEDRDVQQAHLCMGIESIDRHDERRFALDVLNTILGGGMSSRLFKRIREDLGLAYSVFSSPNFYLDTGLFIIYIGTEPSNARQTLEITQEEIVRLTREPVPNDTLRIAKEKLKGNLLLALETSNARMVRLGLGEIYSMHTTLEALAAKVEAVTAEDILGIAQAIFSNKRLSLCLIGPEADLANVKASIN